MRKNEKGMSCLGMLIERRGSSCLIRQYNASCVVLSRPEESRFLNRRARSCFASNVVPCVGSMATPAERSGQGCRDLAQRLGNAARVLTEPERYLVPRLAAGLERLMDMRIADLLKVARRLGSPVFWCYMSDGWGCDISESKAVKTDIYSSRVTTRHRAEFLAENIIVNSLDADDKTLSLLKCLPPRAIKNKSGWDIFAASCEQPFLRYSCPSQILVSWHLQDGLHAASMVRRQQARHELYYDVVAESTLR